MTGIYTITAPNGSIYVGQTRNFHRRKWEYGKYKAKKQPKLNNAILKYGWENFLFKIRIILQENVSQQTLNFWEEYLITYYKGSGIEMLNLTSGGDANRHSEETKLKIGAANKGKLLGKKGHPWTNSQREKMTKLMKSRGISKEHLLKMQKAIVYKRGPSHPDYGVSRTEEEKLKMRLNHPRLNGKTHPRATPIIQMDKNGVPIKEWGYICDAANVLNIWRQNIGKCLRGELSSAGGYKWKYKI